MVVDADVSQIPAGVDGEALVLDAPVRCTVQPAALRVKVASVTVPGARYQAPHGLEAVAERTTDGDRETSQLPRISGGPVSRAYSRESR